MKIEYELFLRYIDDIRVLLRKLLKGSVIRNNMLVLDEEQAKADDLLEDPEVMVAARILRQIMNGLVEGISFTTETRADFVGDWGVPTLDTTWRTVEGGAGERRKVGYRFYKK